MTTPRDEAAFEQVLGKLYDAVLDDAGLPLAMQALTDWLDGDTCHLVGWDQHTATPMLSITCGLPDDVGIAYAAHYGELDPRRHLAEALPQGNVLCCHEHFTPRFVDRSEFYQDYLLPLGIHYLLGTGNLLDSTRYKVQLGIQHYRGRAPFDGEDVSRLRRVLPHLRRVLGLRMRHAEQLARLKTSEQALNFLDQALLILDPGFKVLLANGPAQALLRRQQVLRSHGGVVRGVGAHQDLLGAHLHKVLHSGQPETLCLPASQAGERCVITLYRLGEAQSIASGHGGYRLMLLIAFEQGVPPSPPLLRQLFGLTGAEAELASALAQGLRVSEHAVARGISEATARTQLKSVLQKTGARRQQDLARLLAILPRGHQAAS